MIQCRCTPSLSYALYGTVRRPSPQLEDMEPCFWEAENYDDFWMHFGGFSPRYGGCGADLFGPASSAKLGLRFSFLDRLGRGVGTSHLYVCYQEKENGGANRPHDAHDVGSRGLLGPQRHYNPKENWQSACCGQRVWL